jgi:hypothetical protein
LALVVSRSVPRFPQLRSNLVLALLQLPFHPRFDISPVNLMGLQGLIVLDDEGDLSPDDLSGGG